MTGVLLRNRFVARDQAMNEERLPVFALVFQEQAMLVVLRILKNALCVFAFCSGIACSHVDVSSIPTEQSVQGPASSTGFSAAGYLLSSLSDKETTTAPPCGCHRALPESVEDTFDTCWTALHCVQEKAYRDEPELRRSFAVGFGNPVVDADHYDATSLPRVVRIVAHPYWQGSTETRHVVDHDLALVRYDPPTPKVPAVRMGISFPPSGDATPVRIVGYGGLASKKVTSATNGDTSFNPASLFPVVQRTASFQLSSPREWPSPFLALAVSDKASCFAVRSGASGSGVYLGSNDSAECESSRVLGTVVGGLHACDSLIVLFEREHEYVDCAVKKTKEPFPVIPPLARPSELRSAQGEISRRGFRDTICHQAFSDISGLHRSLIYAERGYMTTNFLRSWYGTEPVRFFPERSISGPALTEWIRVAFKITMSNDKPFFTPREFVDALAGSLGFSALVLEPLFPGRFVASSDAVTRAEAAQLIWRLLQQLASQTLSSPSSAPSFAPIPMYSAP